MGRGLSDLQQDIIAMAYENKNAGVVSYRVVGDNYAYEQIVVAQVKREQILTERFGWEPDTRRGRSGVFSRTDIGAERYNRVMASLSRSLRRLQQRGLVWFTHSVLAKGWSGVELTEEGEAEAMRIMERRDAIG